MLWASTATTTRGGVASYVRSVRATPLWSTWGIRHVATHTDGSAVARLALFARSLVVVGLRLAVRPPALLHLHTASRGSFARKSVLALLARRRGVPVVVHVHGGGFADFHDAAPRWLRRWIRHTLESADVVVALGAGWAAQLRRIAPGARIEVVPNAVVPPATVIASPGAPPVALFLGLVHADKGVPVLVDAWSEVRARLPGLDARLVVAGDGDLDGLRRQVAARRLGDVVETPGWVGPDDVARLLDGAAVLVLPSRAEGHPMAVLEAMAHARPVVATAVGGLPDLVDDTSGRLVPPDDVAALADALVEVLGDPATRERLGAGARARVLEHFDVAVTSRRLDALYRELTGRSDR
ncbi:glycosyltransferase [Nocardioides lentus]|uniref:Glycosyltransferase n=1 Tax=Nocardioides lentus TaxID=338077 RepID=A0ABN2PF49_9ACTN